METDTGMRRTGNRGDAFPNDAAEWLDSDMDGLGDNADAFPFDPTQKVDADGDGMGDNPMGIGADKFPDDAHSGAILMAMDTETIQKEQILMPSSPMPLNGPMKTAMDTGIIQLEDCTTNSHSIQPNGLMKTATDLGTTQNGTDADPSLNDFDNDGYNDSIDPLAQTAEPW